MQKAMNRLPSKYWRFFESFGQVSDHEVAVLEVRYRIEGGISVGRQCVSCKPRIESSDSAELGK